MGQLASSREGLRAGFRQCADSNCPLTVALSSSWGVWRAALVTGVLPHVIMPRKEGAGSQR